MGAALLTRRLIIEKLGLLDEYFWQYFDEIDFCQRVAEAGWQNYYLATTEILHHKGTAFSQQRALFKQYHWTRSLWHYSSKHWSSWQRWLLCPWLGLGFILAFLQQAFKIRRRKPAYL
jgi:GT2 family glycosyltransferase